MSAHPWLKFYPQDWRGEPTLRACSIAARGLWIEMIALAHEGTPYGHVLVNGNVPDVPTLARLAGVAESECESLIAELERNGVFSRTRKGVIYSRRMVKDAKKAAHARNIGKKGGNPSLSKQSENETQVNPTDKLQDKPQIPYARGYIDSVPNGTGAAAPKPVDPAKPCYDVGKPLLQGYGHSASKAGGLITKWLKSHPPEVLLPALQHAASAVRHDIVAFIEGYLRNGISAETQPERSSERVARATEILRKRDQENLQGVP